MIHRGHCEVAIVGYCTCGLVDPSVPLEPLMKFPGQRMPPEPAASHVDSKPPQDSPAAEPKPGEGGRGSAAKPIPSLPAGEASAPGERVEYRHGYAFPVFEPEASAPGERVLTFREGVEAAAEARGYAAAERDVVAWLLRTAAEGVEYGREHSFTMLAKAERGARTTRMLANALEAGAHRPERKGEAK